MKPTGKQDTTVIDDEHALDALADAVRVVGAAALQNPKLAGVSDILSATFKALAAGDPWLAETARSADRWLRGRSNEGVDGPLWGHDGRTSDPGRGYALAAKVLLLVVGDAGTFVDVATSLPAISSRLDLSKLYSDGAPQLVAHEWEAARSRDPESLCKSGLRALGASEQWTRNLFGADEQRTRRNR